MKIKKLDLSKLKVKSFITEMDNQKRNTAKGGGKDSLLQICPIGDPDDTLDYGCVDTVDNNC